MVFTPAVFAVFVVLGVIAALNLSLTAQIVIVCSLIAVWIFACIRNRAADMVMLFMIASFAAGSGITLRTISDTNNTVVNYIGRYVTLEGVILSPGQESSISDNYKYPLRIKKIDKHGEISENVNETILLTTPERLKCGDSISVTGIIKDLASAMNENGMDTAKYYKSQGMFARIYSEDISHIEDIKIFSPKLIGGRISEYIDSVIYKYYTGDTAAILSAVLTGNTHHFSGEYEKLLKLTAFKRLFHPAYVHIMLITFLFSLISTRIPMKIRKISMAVLLLIMAVINCGSIGFFRCTLTCAGVILYRLKNGSVHTPDVIAWVVIICVVSSPLVIYNAGFVMSVTAGIIIWAFLPLFSKYFKFIPKIMRHTSMVMILCTVMQLPLTAYYFDGICPYAIFLPFVMVPMVIVILVSAPCTFIMYSLFGTAPVIGAYLEACLWIILRLPGLVHSLPFSAVWLRVPTRTELISCICFDFALYYYMKEKHNKALYFGTVCAGMIAASAISYAGRAGTADFTFVNVGQGDGAVINSPFGARLIIDGGGGNAYSGYNPGESIFVPYLISKGYSDIDAAIISHFHKDHVEGVIAAVETLNVKSVFAPAPQDNWSDEMYEYKSKLEYAAAEKGTQINYISQDTKISFDCGINIFLYAPNEAVNISDDDNDRSMLIKAEYGNTSAIYTGDLSAYAEKGYMSSGADVSADIMKVGHHGSKGSTAEEWVKAVAPKYAVISCGEDNPYGHPTEQTLERLSGIPVLRTDINGTITFTADKEKIKSIYIFR